MSTQGGPFHKGSFPPPICEYTFSRNGDHTSECDVMQPSEHGTTVYLGRPEVSPGMLRSGDKHPPELTANSGLLDIAGFKKNRLSKNVQVQVY